MRALLLAALLLLPAAVAAQTRFRFPAVDPQGLFFMTPPLIGVDHDGSVAGDGLACLNFAGEPFPYCYNDHHGTDFLLTSGFETMKENVAVVAGADGVVVEVVDGNYDRCHSTSAFQVTCDGQPMVANRVVLRHADGLQSSYHHLMKGSVAVRVGDAVRCGQPLGLVGSSGHSAMPHLHFEVRDAQGKAIDPFAGSKSQPSSYWLEQDGLHARPGARCPGEPTPAADAGAGRLLDGGTAPSADAGDDPGLPGRETDDARLRVGLTGCAVGGDGLPGTALSLLVLLLLAGRSRRRVSR